VNKLKKQLPLWLAGILVITSVVWWYRPQTAQAAIAITTLTASGSQTGATSYTTASVSPTANTLILLSVASRTGITADPTQPTATGNGLTWVVVSTTVFDNTSSSRQRHTVFRAMGASPSTGTIVIDEAGQSQTSMTWAVEQVTGIDTSGTNGSGAIVQAVANQDTTETGTTLTVTLAAFSSASNATFGSFGYNNPAQAATHGSGFTTVDDVCSTTCATADSRVTTEWTSANDTTVDMSYAAAGAIGGIALELKPAASAPTVSAFTIYNESMTLKVGAVNY
jgi:hypothetical protein